MAIRTFFAAVFAAFAGAALLAQSPGLPEIDELLDKVTDYVR